MRYKWFAVIVTLILAVGLLAPAIQAAPVRAYPLRPSLDFKFPNNVAKSWVNYGQDSLATNVPKLLSDSTFVGMRVNQDTLRFISNSNADSTYLVIYGITSSDSLNANLVEERIRISGKDTVYASKKYAQFEMASADTESAGTILVMSSRYGTLTVLRPGNLTTRAAVHFTGSRGGGITGWTAALDTLTNAGAPNAAIRFELRVYPDFKDFTATPETGYYVVDRANLMLGTVTATVSASGAGRTGGRSFVKDFGAPVFIPAHSATGIYVASSSGTITSGVRVSGSLVGYDSNP